METSSKSPEPTSVAWKGEEPNQEAVKSVPERKPRSLSTLPVELQIHLLPFLDYYSLRDLSQTSKHFRSLFANSTSRDIIKQALLALELDAHQRQSTIPGRVLLLPCYCCLRILNFRDRFSSSDLYWSIFHELGGDNARSRRCMSCRYYHVTACRQSEIFVRGSQCWIACAGCRQVKLYVATNGIMKIAWTMSRKCVECAKVEVADDEGKRELWKDSFAKLYRWKQAAVARQEPVEMTTVAAVTEGPAKPEKRSSQSDRWSILRRVFLPGR